MALLAACACVARWSILFFGIDLNALILAFVETPKSPPLPIMVLAATAVAGLALLISAFRAAFFRGDGPPMRSSLLVTAAASLALVCGWYPHTWGALWLRGMETAYVALIAGGTANLCLAAGSRFWVAGYVAAELGGAAPHSYYADEWQDVIERQALTIEQLSAERDRLARDLAKRAPAGDLETFIEILGGRRKVLASCHPDRFETEPDKRAATERFQKLQTILSRISGRS